jgi:hypothetical protein
MSGRVLAAVAAAVLFWRTRLVSVFCLHVPAISAKYKIARHSPSPSPSCRLAHSGPFPKRELGRDFLLATSNRPSRYDIIDKSQHRRLHTS